jgi:ADP-ribose pyrophosphatase YjhB (NUDIX family)
MAEEKIIIAAGPVIIENNKILLNQHGSDNLWKFPGGKLETFDFVDWNEALEETAKREVKEEMGIDIEIIKPLKPMITPRPGRQNEFVILIHYLAARKGDIKPGVDIDAWDWFSFDNLPKNCAPNIRPVLNSLK